MLEVLPGLLFFYGYIRWTVLLIAFAVAAMHQRHRLGAIEELLRPVKRLVASADDDDALPAKFFRVRHPIENSASVPRLGALLRQAPRRECPNSRGDDDRPRRKAVRLGDKHEVIVVALERGDVLVKVRLEMKLR